MILILLYLFVLVSLFMKRFKYVSTVLLSVAMGYFAGTMSPEYSNDTSSYLNFYGFSPESRVFETGYMKVANFFFNHGFDYFEFRTITYIIAFLVLWLGVVRIVKSPEVFYALYFPFTFINDATQVRNFWLVAILVFSISLVRNRGIFRIFISILLICIAATIQNLAYLYLIPLILFWIPWNSRTLKIVIVGILGITLFSIGISFFGKSSVVFSNMIQSFGSLSSRADGADNLARYASASGGVKNLVRAFFESLTYMAASVYIITRFMKASENVNSIWSLHNRQNRIAFLIIVVSMIGVPITFVSMAFDRIMRNGFIIILLLIAKNFVPTKLPSFEVRKYSAGIFALAMIYAAANYLLTNLAELSFYMLKLMH